MSGFVARFWELLALEKLNLCYFSLTFSSTIVDLVIVCGERLAHTHRVKVRISFLTRFVYRSRRCSILTRASIGGHVLGPPLKLLFWP